MLSRRYFTCVGLTMAVGFSIPTVMAQTSPSEDERNIDEALTKEFLKFTLEFCGYQGYEETQRYKNTLSEGCGKPFYMQKRVLFPFRNVNWERNGEFFLYSNAQHGSFFESYLFPQCTIDPYSDMEYTAEMDEIVENYYSAREVCCPHCGQTRTEPTKKGSMIMVTPDDHDLSINLFYTSYSELMT